jgi:hypothetical protein
MRARLYELTAIGDKTLARTIYLDRFPVVVSRHPDGQVSIQADPNGAPVCCRIHEQDGNLVMEGDPSSETWVNDLPLLRGGLLPGDRVRFGERTFIVSYERTTSVPSPSAIYRLAAGMFGRGSIQA